MSATDDERGSAIDFAIAAYRDDGEWGVATLPPQAASELTVLLQSLAGMPSEVGTLGMVSVEDDFFVLARVSGSHVRLMLSDIGAATESPFAMSVVEHLHLPPPDDDDDTMQPAGDLTLLADLGVSAMELGAICDEPDLYPDELLADIAGRLGFGNAFDDIVDAVLA